MITCAHCCQKCPDDAPICPNCGKPIFTIPADDTPNYAELAERLNRENDSKQDIQSQKKLVYKACAILLLSFVVYNIFAR